jgi:hypothetical protein
LEVRDCVLPSCKFYIFSAAFVWQHSFSFSFCTHTSHLSSFAGSGSPSSSASAPSSSAFIAPELLDEGCWFKTLLFDTLCALPPAALAARFVPILHSAVLQVRVTKTRVQRVGMCQIFVCSYIDFCREFCFT